MKKHGALGQKVIHKIRRKKKIKVRKTGRFQTETTEHG